MKFIGILVLFSLSLSSFASRSLYANLVEEQTRLLIERKPASSEIDDSKEHDLQKLLNKGYVIYKKNDGSFLAKKNNRTYTLFNDHLCTNKQVDLSDAVKKGYAVSNVNSDLYLSKNEKRVLVHPSFKMICYKF